ncbi:Digeranylgeranylglycerophospholipid reductase [uncultured archaeon]|nr:Digeranylgeranylglycerophospholipid reductase [uncultured archaeon]
MTGKEIVYDVIIAGAGPAGLAAGIELAKGKANVLILDRKQEIGCPKRCAEGLSNSWFNIMKLTPNPEWAVQKIKGAVLWAPNGKSVKMKDKKELGYVLERKMFEKHLAIEAAKLGAKILLKHQIIEAKRENGIVTLKVEVHDHVEEFKAKMVIACDGIDSLVARMLGLNTANNLKDTDSGYQYEMTNISGYDEDCLHMYFGNEVAPRGYIWIFPKRDGTANVGIGIGAYVSAETKINAKGYLDRWIEKQPGLKDGSIIEVNAGGIPVGGFLEKMDADNLLVAGDAGHMVDPIHGGGIGIAMEGGRLAAQVALKAVKANDYTSKTLGTYTKEWFTLRGNKLKTRLKSRHLLEHLSDDDFNYLAESITMDEALKIGNGSLSKSEKVMLFTIKLIKRPKLIAIMKKFFV